MLRTIPRPVWALINGFAALGAVGSVLVARQPEFQSRWGLDAAEWGWVLFAAGLGGMLAYPVNKWFLACWGSRKMLHRFGTAGGVVMAVIPWLPGLPGLLLGMFVQGLIYNGVGVAVNHQAVEWELRSSARMMGRLHATFYVGSMLSAFVSGVLAATGLALSIHMAVVGLLAALFHRHAAKSLPRALPPDPDVAASVTVRGAWLPLGVLAACHGVVESGIMGWTAIYLHQSMGAGEGAAGIGLALFAGAMALGRFGSDAVVMRFGPAPVIIGGAVACALALGVSAVTASLTLALAALIVCGFGLAAAAPIIFSAAGRLGGDVLARVFAVGAVGGLLGPLVLGQIAKITSLDAVMLVLAVVSAVMAWQSRILLDKRSGAPATADRAGAMAGVGSGDPTGSDSK
ncbi:MAG: MFS transporter [Azoarcus sp.]|nr:MFS transporter [Azoarcus sp.]